jgi:hypothetical protein
MKIQLKGFLPSSDKLIAGWWCAETEGEQLCLLFSDGRLFRIRNEAFWEEEQLEETELLEAKPLGNGFFVLDASNRFIYYSCQQPQPQKRQFPIPSCLQFNSPQCWCPLNNSKQVVFALENRLFLCTSEQVFERSCAPYGTICQLTTGNEKKIVALTVDGRCLAFEANESLRLILDISIDFGVLQVDSLKVFDGICVAVQSSTGKVSFVDLEADTGAEFR